MERERVDGAGAPGAAGEGGTGGAGAAGGYLSHKQIMIILPGLIMAMLLAMLDQLVVGTALPRIVGDLGGATHLSWVVTAYVLASTITTPFYGKLGDMYGRKKFFIVAIVIFLVGSALSGLSSSMAKLITFRAIQGLGAGGLMVGAMATLGEIVPPRERGKYMSYFMVVMMLATVGGPLVGGWITTAFSWRWIFYINLPLGGAALVYLIAVMKLPARRVEHRIDYAGGILLGVVATAIILLATWGGTEYQWGSWEIIGLLAIAVAALRRVPRRSSGGPRSRCFRCTCSRVRNFSVTMAADVPRRPRAVRRDDLPAVLPADRAGCLAHGERPADDAADGRLGRHLGPGRRADQQDRQVPDVPDRRRPGHGGRHVPAEQDRRRHLALADRHRLRGSRPRHGLPDADDVADRAEQRRAQGHGRGDRAPGCSSSRWAARSGSPRSARSSRTS